MNTTSVSGTLLFTLTLIPGIGCTGAIEGTDRDPIAPRRGCAAPGKGTAAASTRSGDATSAPGTVSGPGAAPGTPVVPPATALRATPDCRGMIPVGPRRLGRLFPRQYGNTIAVLLGGRTSSARREVPGRGLEVPLQPADLHEYSTYAGNQSLNHFEIRQSLQQLPATAASLVTALRAKAGSCLAAGSKVAVADCAASIAADRGELLFTGRTRPSR